MGKLARTACIFTPALLSIVSAVILLVVLLGGVDKNNQGLGRLYEYRIDFTRYKKTVAANEYMKPAGSLVDNLLYALRTSAQKNNLKDFYQVYLWNYCSGTGDKVEFCSPRKGGYFFNPVKEWGLDSTLNDRHTPNSVAQPMNVFEKGVHWIFAAYMIALGANVLTIVVGLLAVCSRVGSIIATITASIAAIASFMAALTSTILFKALVGAWSKALSPYMIDISRGSAMLALDWIAFVCSAIAVVFWLFSSCCVSGKSKAKTSPKGKNKFRGFGFGGYKQIDDQEKSLIANSEGQSRAIQQNEETAYTGGYDGATPDNSAQYTAGKGPYTARDSKYEPYRSVDA